MNDSIPVVRVISAAQHVGKTTLVTRLIEALSARGVRVAAVKHSHHPLPADREGSDTARMATAGATAVAFCGPDGLLVRRPSERPPIEAAIEAVTDGADIVIAEGFRDASVGATIRLTGRPPAEALVELPGRASFVTTADDVDRIADGLAELVHAGAVGVPAD